MRVNARVRRFGNSLGVVVPFEEAERMGLSPGDSVELEVVRKANLKDLFGTIKFANSAQEIKDEDRQGWHD
ncbi:MAG: hypothetical protein HY247_02790 [archaeon]|nr:MAG: hypothetical protein HY247_02790 [archaeon]